MTKDQKKLYAKMQEVCDKLDRQFDQNLELAILLKAVPNTIIRVFNKFVIKCEE